MLSDMGINRIKLIIRKLNILLEYPKDKVTQEYVLETIIKIIEDITPY